MADGRVQDFPLPSGWKRVELVQKGTGVRGRPPIIYSHYISPEGERIKSLKRLREVRKTLGKEMYLGGLDFKSGKIDYKAAHARLAYAYGKPPVRLTKRILQGPVTTVRNHPDSETRQDLVHGSNQTPPYQLHWQRSLQYVYANDITRDIRKAARTDKTSGSRREELSDRDTTPDNETIDSDVSSSSIGSIDPENGETSDNQMAVEAQRKRPRLAFQKF